MPLPPPPLPLDTKCRDSFKFPRQNSGISSLQTHSLVALYAVQKAPLRNSCSQEVLGQLLTGSIVTGNEDIEEGLEGDFSLAQVTPCVCELEYPELCLGNSWRILGFGVFQKTYISPFDFSFTLYVSNGQIDFSSNNITVGLLK